MSVVDKLTNRTVLVLGATGNVGHGAARAFLDAGAKVIAPTRSERGVAALREAFAGAQLEPLLGDLSDPEDAPRLVNAVLDRGPIDHVFAALGPWWQSGKVAEQSPAEWARVRAMLLDGHVHAATLLLGPLAQRSDASYTLVTGMGAHQVIDGTSLLFVATGGVLSLSKVLRQEHAEGPVRVNELLIGCRVEMLPRQGVVASAVFGEAATAIANSTVRGEVIRYDGPESFAVPGS